MDNKNKEFTKKKDMFTYKVDSSLFDEMDKDLLESITSKGIKSPANFDYLYNTTFDYSDMYKYTSTATTNTTSTTGSPSTSTTTTTTNAGGSGGSINAGTISLGTSNMGHISTGYGNHTHAIYHDPSYYSFYKQAFSKSDFIKAVVVDGNEVMEYFEKILPTSTDDAIIEFLEYCERFGILTSEVFWKAVDSNIVMYPLYPRYHTVEKCVETIAKNKNKNIIAYTEDSVRNDIEFKRKVNKLKLKGVL